MPLLDGDVFMQNRPSQLDSAGWRVTPSRVARVARVVRVVLGEEHAVPLVRKLSKGGRLSCRVGGEAKAVGGLRRPGNSRVRLQEQSGEALRVVADLRALQYAAPRNVIGDRRRDRRPIGQRVRDAAEIQHSLIRHLQGGRAGAEIDADTLVGDTHGPEQPGGVGVDAKVEVVFLGREVREVILTSVEVQSDKAKGAVVVLPIHTDVLTVHEAHVGVEEEAAGPWPGAGPRPLYVGHADEAVEIGDSGRLLSGA
jgi:hypothetical protein